MREPEAERYGVPGSDETAPGRLAMRTIESVADVDVIKWDRMAEDADVALSHAGVRLAELTAHAQMHYVLLEDGDALVGALCGAEATTDSRWVLGRPDTLLAEAADSGDPRAIALLSGLQDDATRLLPSLILGGRQMGGSAVLADSVQAPSEWEGRTELLVTRMEAIAADRKLSSIAWPFVPESDARLTRLLNKSGYHCFVVDESNVLSVPDGGLEGYLSQFTSRRRWQFRKEIAKVEASGLTWNLRRLADCDISRLAQLETELLHRYGHHQWQPKMSEEAMSTTVSSFGDRALASVVSAGEDAIGFVVLIRHGDQWFARQAGFDYARQGKIPIYFYALFYGPLSVAQAEGVRRINYGIGTEGPKVSRGCVPEVLRTYVRLVEGALGTETGTMPIEVGTT